MVRVSVRSRVGTGRGLASLTQQKDACGHRSGWFITLPLPWLYVNQPRTGAFARLRVRAGWRCVILLRRNVRTAEFPLPLASLTPPKSSENDCWTGMDIHSADSQGSMGCVFGTERHTTICPSTQRPAGAHSYPGYLRPGEGRKKGLTLTRPRLPAPPPGTIRR